MQCQFPVPRLLYINRHIVYFLLSAHSRTYESSLYNRYMDTTDLWSVPIPTHRPRLPVTTPYSPYMSLSQCQGHLFCQPPHLLHWLFVSQPQQQLIAIAITCAFVWEIPRDSLYINIHEGGARVVCVILGKGVHTFENIYIKFCMFKSQSLHRHKKAHY